MFLLSLNVCKLKTFDLTNATIFSLTFGFHWMYQTLRWRANTIFKQYIYYVWFMHVSAQKCCGWGCGCRRMCAPPGVTEWPGMLMITPSTEWPGKIMITLSWELPGNSLTLWNQISKHKTCVVNNENITCKNFWRENIWPALFDFYGLNLT